MQPIRLALAYALAPAVPAVVVCLPGILFAGDVDGVFRMFLLASAVSYGHALVLGVPVAVVLMRRGPLTRSRVLGAGFLIGSLPLATLMAYSELVTPFSGSSSFIGVVHRIDGHLTTSAWISMVEGILTFGVYGAGAGLVWWWLARPAPKATARRA